MLRRNVLIFHSGALGDFVLTWPLGLALSRLWPQSRIIYVTHKQKGLLAEKVLRVEWSDADAGWHHLFGDAGNLPLDCRKKLEGAQAVFGFGKMAPWPGAVEVSVKPPEDWKEHALEFLLETLGGQPVVRAAVGNMLSSIAARGISVARGAGAEVVIHPGSGSAGKCWPIENFASLAERLVGEGRRVKFVVGEVEIERWPEGNFKRLESVAPVVMPGTYLELLDLIAGAEVFVGNDSGPGHLAGIVGVRSVILFGPSDPGVWKPLGPRVTALRRQPLADLSVDEVESAIVSQGARV
jgi:ADP-heptose:LPS heptosyltransferase